ncbi:hypothetical protein X874_19410 [Mannheimia varigena USDA-ARS-USMARC-1312]|nr:hypothetical protein X874_19410 [Mannheimia varigena USDA-ARS-USMARC-1312]
MQKNSKITPLAAVKPHTKNNGISLLTYAIFLYALTFIKNLQNVAE